MRLTRLHDLHINERLSFLLTKLILNHLTTAVESNYVSLPFGGKKK